MTTEPKMPTLKFCTCDESKPFECDGCRFNREAREPKMPPLPVQFHEHPDIAGGVKWSDCELRWITNRDQQWNEQVTVLENKLALAEEAGRELSDNYIKRGDRLDATLERVAELERVLDMAHAYFCLPAGLSAETLNDMQKFKDAMAGIEQKEAALKVAIDAARSKEGGGV